MTAPTEQEVEAMAQRIAQWSDFNRAEAAALLRRLWAERDALLRVVAAADKWQREPVGPKGLSDKESKLVRAIGEYAAWQHLGA